MPQLMSQLHSQCRTYQLLRWNLPVPPALLRETGIPGATHNLLGRDPARSLPPTPPPGSAPKQEEEVSAASPEGDEEAHTRQVVAETLQELVSHVASGTRPDPPGAPPLVGEFDVILPRGP
eukprot:CAMPEP_0118984698 /NCGR_PEP_ID=MMETSP1173-20130426/38337_1 /TAXON_ID=1034831 /ORGANISM="Rhizochromulina marina cf, Strain CCMP1243" /LENGTH=120 /DNA_ID=CAMNT_0006935375 /DNA_START=30 /DNA_END=389 /DNA_ORIENTATION=+